MEKVKLGVYRRRLADEKVRLVRMIGRNRIAVGEIRVEHTEDEGDLAIISHDRELLYNLNQGDLTLLKAIESAVERMDRGQYGECLNCEEPISEMRLAAVPWVALCVRCQEQTETDHASERHVAAHSEPDVPEF